MQKYQSIFTKVLLKEAPVTVSPPAAEQKPPAPLSDSDVWGANNQTIMDKPELKKHFDVEGIPPDVTEHYVKRVETWKDSIGKIQDSLSEIYNFAAENADKPGVDQIFSTIGSVVESLQTDLGTLGGHLRTLGLKIKVSMGKERKKNMDR